jgi:hypothetical protein
VRPGLRAVAAGAEVACCCCCCHPCNTSPLDKCTVASGAGASGNGTDAVAAANKLGPEVKPPIILLLPGSEVNGPPNDEAAVVRDAARDARTGDTERLRVGLTLLLSERAERPSVVA